MTAEERVPAKRLAARATAILVYRADPSKAEFFERRGCDDLDRRYRSLRNVLHRAGMLRRADYDFSPPLLYEAILHRSQSDEKFLSRLDSAISREFPSAFARLAVYIAAHWREVDGDLRALAQPASTWAEQTILWTVDDEVLAEFESTALILYLLTHLWLLRRIARHGGIFLPEELRAVIDFPGLAFSAVLDEELEEIAWRRERGRQALIPEDDMRGRGQDQPPEKDVPTECFRADLHPAPRADSAELAGLAFSGGGIRSATFNLGVMQYLGQARLLRHFDYLSTVSGGGYIGTWLHAWIHHSDGSFRPGGRPRGRSHVEACLSPGAMDNPQDPRVAPITFLRRYASYLTPQKGVFSTDTWTMLNIWLRNTFLNLLVLVLPLIALLLIPRGLNQTVMFVDRFHASQWWWTMTIPAAIFIGINLWVFSGDPTRQPAPGRGRAWRGRLRDRAAHGWPVFAFLLVPLFAGSWLAAAYFEIDVPAERFDSRMKDLRDSINDPQTPANYRADEVQSFQRLWGGDPEPKAAEEFEDKLQDIPPAQKADRWADELRTREMQLADLNRRMQNAGEAARQQLENDADVIRNDIEAMDDGAPNGEAFASVMGVLLLVISAAGWERTTRKTAKAGPLRLAREYLRRGGEALTALAFSAISAGIGTLAYVLVVQVGAFRHVWRLEQGLAFGPGVFLGLISGIIFLHMGLLGRRLPDYKREWLARACGALGIFALGWTGLAAIALFSRPLMNELYANITRPAVGGAVFAWLGSTLYGALSARKVASGTDALYASALPKLRGVLVKLAPPMFALTLLVLLSWGTARALDGPAGGNGAAGLVVAAGQKIDQSLGGLGTNESRTDVGFFAISLIVLLALWLSGRVDVNEFSLHQFYRNRLVRCYLGGSRANERDPNPFTGFDAQDDLHLSVFAPSRGYSGPYPILNTTLNVVHGDELAWQERKGESFVFTPRFCGFDVGTGRAIHDRTGSRRTLSYGAYRFTEEYACGEGGRSSASDGGSGLRIGTAMAISGAAASPNMGPRSSLSLAFLMTLLDVRLGWWLGNPRRNDSWREPGPSTGLWHLMAEMTSWTNDSGKYVYLSDGGHFENLGIYELVRRRCRYIVACDSEQDKNYEFGGLGNAIRKCRSDFGVEIDIDISQLKPLPGEHLSRAHFSVGKIYYPGRSDFGDAGDKARGPVGTLIYIKSSLTGTDEPADLLQYSMRVPEFPHESTANQWFDETHFESYRTLGHHVAEAAFLGLQNERVRSDIAEGRFKDALRPPEEAVSVAAS